MAGDAFRKVSQGDKLVIPATAYNAFIDAALESRAGKIKGGAGPGSFTVRRTDVLSVRNDSGADLDRFDILQLSEPIYAAENEVKRNEIVLKGLAVNDEESQRYAVSLQPIGQNKIGLCCWDGICIARVNAQTATDQFARPVNGQTYLEGGNYGSAQIIWMPGSGLGFGIVHLGTKQPRPPVVGLLTEELVRGGTAAFDVYAIDPTGGITGEAIESLTMIDSGMIPASVSPLPVDTLVGGMFIEDLCVLVSFDCDAVI